MCSAPVAPALRCGLAPSARPRTRPPAHTPTARRRQEKTVNLRDAVPHPTSTSKRERSVCHTRLHLCPSRHIDGATPWGHGGAAPCPHLPRFLDAGLRLSPKPTPALTLVSAVTLMKPPLGTAAPPPAGTWPRSCSTSRWNAMSSSAGTIAKHWKRKANPFSSFQFSVHQLVCRRAAAGQSIQLHRHAGRGQHTGPSTPTTKAEAPLTVTCSCSRPSCRSIEAHHPKP